MAKSEDRTPGSGRYKTDIHEAKRECKLVFEACTEYKNGSAPYDLKKKLAAKTRKYYEELREYKDDSQRSAELWDDSDVDDIPTLHNTRVQTEMEASGDTAATRKVEQIALVAMDHEDVNYYINQLDDIRHALNFAADVEDETPHTEASHTDLQELVGMRGQEETLDKIPGDG